MELLPGSKRARSYSRRMGGGERVKASPKTHFQKSTRSSSFSGCPLYVQRELGGYGASRGVGRFDRGRRRTRGSTGPGSFMVVSTSGPGLFTGVCTNLCPRQALCFCGDRTGHKRCTKGIILLLPHLLLQSSSSSSILDSGGDRWRLGMRGNVGSLPAQPCRTHAQGKGEAPGMGSRTCCTTLGGTGHRTSQARRSRRSHPRTLR